MTNAAWTKEKIAALLRYTREGKSAAEIGRKFGLTRSAVLGKLFRVRAKEGEDITPRMITGRPKGEVKPKAAPTAPKITKDKTDKGRQRQIYTVLNRAGKYLKSTGFNPTPGLSTKPVKVKKTKWDDVDPKTPGLIRMTDLKNGMCRWPMNNALRGEFYFCGAQAEMDKPYCKEHHVIAYVPKGGK